LIKAGDSRPVPPFVLYFQKSVNPPDRSEALAPAFSLVEVTIALAICSFCLLALLGLIPVGLQNARDTIGQTGAANLARAIGADLQTASAAGRTTSARFQIPLPTTTAASGIPAKTLFFAEDGETTNAGATTALPSPTRYRVDISYGERTALTAPAPVRILVTWPPDGAVGGWPAAGRSGFESITALNP